MLFIYLVKYWSKMRKEELEEEVFLATSPLGQYLAQVGLRDGTYPGNNEVRASESQNRVFEVRKTRRLASITVICRLRFFLARFLDVFLQYNYWSYELKSIIFTSQLLDNDDVDYVHNVLDCRIPETANDGLNVIFMILAAVLPILPAIILQNFSSIFVAVAIGIILLLLITYCVMLKIWTRKLLHLLNKFAENQKTLSSNVKRLIKELKEREIMFRGYLMLKAPISSFDNATLREISAVSNLTDARNSLHSSLVNQFLALRHATTSLLRKREMWRKTQDDEDLLKNCCYLVRMSLSDFQALKEKEDSITIDTLMTCLQYVCLQRSEFLRLILIIFCSNIKSENSRWDLIYFLRACENCIIDVQNCSMKIHENVEVLIRLNSAKSILKRELKPINVKLDPSSEERSFRSLFLHTQLALERLTSHEDENFNELLNFVEFQLKAATICIEQIRDSQTEISLESRACPHNLNNMQTDINQQPVLFDESNILPIKDEVFEAYIAESVQTTEVTVKDANDDVRSKIDKRSKSNLLTELKSVLTIRHDLMLEREWKVVSEKQNITFDEFKLQYFALKKIGADNSHEQSMNNVFRGRKAQNSTILQPSSLSFGNFRDELSNAVSRLRSTQCEVDFIGDDDND